MLIQKGGWITLLIKLILIGKPLQGSNNTGKQLIHTIVLERLGEISVKLTNHRNGFLTGISVTQPRFDGTAKTMLLILQQPPR